MVMMSFAAPALAQEQQQLKPLAPITDDLPVLEPDSPNISERVPDLCSGEDLPVLEPVSPDKADPPIADPPPGKNDPVVDPPPPGKGDGGIGGSASQTIDRGGTFGVASCPPPLQAP